MALTCSMMKIMSDKLNGCLLRYPVMCFKGFFVKKFTLCQLLNQQPAFLLSTHTFHIPQGILTVQEGQYSLHEDHHPVQVLPSAFQVSRFPSFSD
ncbi:Uncharacterized protein APZ42_033926 [Daphnia magna]|uniref:Uncharacterized protein n=1 Tax=Daphnia magna TaxID=35525 RepID=A0A164KLB1_9CRUS|nr:Uncharacterized protein APZ42_033926 [Daphnia magna]